MTDHGHREDRRDFALRQSETAQQRQCDDADADVQLKDFWFCKRRRECYLSFGTSADGEPMGRDSRRAPANHRSRSLEHP